jgi:ribonuclease HII
LGREQKLLEFDERFAGEFEGPIAGVDEAGRGPLAGPVVAAAVTFHRKVNLSGLDDSKKLSAKIRERLFGQIMRHAWVGIGRVPEAIIDKINILQATRMAMREAVLALPRTPVLLLIDGRIRLDLPLPQQGIVRGDGKSAAIAAASIIAKVYRDSWMKQLDAVYPHYGFARHKGYPTQLHLSRLRLKGATAVHRKTFRPVAEVLAGAKNG